MQSSNKETLRRWRSPLILATTLFVLSSAAYWLEFRKKPESERSEEESRKVFALNRSQVASIVIRVQGKPEIRLSCLDPASGLCKAGSLSRWQLESPIKVKADDSNVQALLSSLNNLVPAGSINLGEEPTEQRPALLRQYGLEGAQLNEATSVEVELAGGGGKKTLYLGEAHPMGENRYAILLSPQDSQSTPTRVLLLPKSGLAQLDKPATHWREKRFVPLDAALVDSVVQSVLPSAGPDRKLTASKSGTGWSLSTGAPGVAIPGDVENINSWLSSITFLTAEEFEAEKKDSDSGRKVLSGSRPVLRFVISAGDAKKFDFEVREKKTAGAITLLAVSSSLDPVFRLDTEAAKRLTKTSKDLQLSKLLGSIDRFNVRRITVAPQSRGQTAFELRSDASGAGWSLADGKPVDAAKVTTLLEKLSGNRILDWKAATQGLESEARGTGLKLTLRDQKDALIRELLLWKSGAKGTQGTRLLALDEGRVLEINPEVMSALPWNEAFLAPGAEAKK